MNANPKWAPKRNWWRLLLVILVLVVAGAAFVVQNRSDGQPPQQSAHQAFAVRAAAVVQKTVPVELSAIGSVHGAVPGQVR
jgi:hypothetical protein